ncbi:hypothetical protein HPFOLIGI_00545 [Mannheimia haemolytica]
MTKFFETIAFVMLFGIIPSCLLAINTTLMNMNIKKRTVVYGDYSVRF